MFVLSECWFLGVVVFFRLFNLIWCLVDVIDGILEMINGIDYWFGLVLVVIVMVFCGFLLIEYGGENWLKDY